MTIAVNECVTQRPSPGIAQERQPFAQCRPSHIPYARRFALAPSAVVRRRPETKPCASKHHAVVVVAEAMRITAIDWANLLINVVRHKKEIAIQIATLYLHAFPTVGNGTKPIETLGGIADFRICIISGESANNHALDPFAVVKNILNRVILQVNIIVEPHEEIIVSPCCFFAFNRPVPSQAHALAPK